MVVASKKRNWWLGQGRRKIYLYIMYLLYFLDFVQHACITYSKLQLERRTTKKEHCIYPSILSRAFLV